MVDQSCHCRTAVLAVSDMAEVEAAMEVIAEVEVREEEEQLSIADDVIQ